MAVVSAEPTDHGIAVACTSSQANVWPDLRCTT